MSSFLSKGRKPFGGDKIPKGKDGDQDRARREPSRPPSRANSQVSCGSSQLAENKDDKSAPIPRLAKESGDLSQEIKRILTDLRNICLSSYGLNEVGAAAKHCMGILENFQKGREIMVTRIQEQIDRGMIQEKENTKPHDKISKEIQGYSHETLDATIKMKKPILKLKDDFVRYEKVLKSDGSQNDSHMMKKVQENISMLSLLSDAIAGSEVAAQSTSTGNIFQSRGSESKRGKRNTSDERWHPRKPARGSS